MRILSAAFVDTMAGTHAQHPPFPAAGPSRTHTHARAIAEGRSEHGCTVHFVSAELDAGPIVAQARVPVMPGDDAETLAARVLIEEHRIYPQALDALARSLSG